MINIKELLKSKPVLLDGAMGTELFKAGLVAGYPPELWNIENPEAILNIHKNYLNAGAKIIETNTFGANKFRLSLSNHAGMVNKLNQAGAQLAKEAAGNNAFVAGSVGPLGEMIEPFGPLSSDDALNAFYGQISALGESGVDLILIETMISLEEALIALKCVKKNFSLPAAVSLTFELRENEIVTPFGERLEDAIIKLEAEGADIIGSNCGNGFDEMAVIGNKFKDNSHLPVLLQPNAGIPRLENSILVYNGSPENYARFVQEMDKIGIEFLGGCCGTDYNHIKQANVIISHK